MTPPYRAELAPLEHSRRSDRRAGELALLEHSRRSDRRAAELALLEHFTRSDRKAAEQAPLYRGFEFFWAMSRDVLIACDRSMIGAFGDLAGSGICSAGHFR
ncbi:hypothetical protein EA658_08470 [Pseudoxanthomonas winnipegensis]|jgi:hypothetical protein|uniref:Uncharacterized protein n=1 Tax=Pseudoxanthomonas winnipegensis TaxID=2480810 RepID=A0ABY1WGA8_9GAMM|nr:hypothetical protein [Pseudoxanthomonas winnipegensis]TAA07962.1 hypothetical protein EA659_14765 [Pseudoxanthomonas winnipegensis]TAA20954.1 hypothetical protein EA658_08470 [Pseudoxanthomonas winnipegensis]TAH72423.1 hypothetical protein EA657_09190 [Pseudoxanthomonas winnipegensis]